MLYLVWYQLKLNQLQNTFWCPFSCVIISASNRFIKRASCSSIPPSWYCSNHCRSFSIMAQFSCIRIKQNFVWIKSMKICSVHIGDEAFCTIASFPVLVKCQFGPQTRNIKCMFWNIVYFALQILSEPFSIQ